MYLCIKLHDPKEDVMTATATLSTHVDVEIRKPADEVWAVVADYATDTAWRKGISEMSADRVGPPQVGTKVHEVLTLGGREYVTDTVVTEVGPMSYRFAGEGTSGVVRGRRSVVPSGDGSAVFAYDVEVEPHAIPRLARPLLRWWLQHSLRRDLGRLRTMVETAP
jgi:Polyketide cyclase / dehydrase and lipid transport